jgi:cell division protein FtsB
VIAGALRGQKTKNRKRRRSGRPVRASLFARWSDALNGLGLRGGIALLSLLLILLQVRLWAGDGGVRELWRLGHQIEAQRIENGALRERNEALNAEVLDLKEGAAAIEERARRELSMIRRDETFFQSVER